MDTANVIMRIHECLKMDPSLRHEGPERAELFRICARNSHLTGMQLFDQFRGHMNVVTLRRLVSTWDTWRRVMANTLIVAQPTRSASSASPPRPPKCVTTA